MGKEITFDSNGFLEPYEIVSCDIPTLEEYFVDAFPKSKTRYELYINYRRYTEDLRTRVSSELVQWIDGSFISQEQNPKDIDLVTFIPHKAFEVHERYLEDFWTYNREHERLDTYLVAFYPKEHELHSKTLGFIEHWKGVYGSKEIGTTSYPKGFLELKFGI